jgi:hypothetical protein
VNPSRVRLCRFVYIWLVVYCPIPISMILEVYDEIPVVPDVAALTMERAYVFMCLCFITCRTYYKAVRVFITAVFNNFLLLLPLIVFPKTHRCPGKGQPLIAQPHRSARCPRNLGGRSRKPAARRCRRAACPSTRGAWR